MSTSPTVELASALIGRASVTPDDQGCQQVLTERLQARGFDCRHLRFGDVDNLWAVYGNSGPLFCFAGHTDVVPAGPAENWMSDPFIAIERDGYLYGRGAADMKGSLAAMVIATETFLEQHPEPGFRIAFLITSDEEGDAIHGTREVMQWLASQNEHIDWCLVGEPSSSQALGDVIKVGRRGSLNADLCVHGTQGHIAYPQLADNPVSRAIPALQALLDIEWDQGNDYFPATSLQISNIQAGTGTTNVIPGELRVLFNFRFSTETSAAQLQSRVETLLKQHQLDFQINWQLSGEPFLTQPGTLISAVTHAVESVTGQQPELSTNGGTSDGRFIAPYGTEVVELGPVNASIHQVNESVRSADLDSLSEIFETLLDQLIDAAH